jgi:hypothetical protein
VRIDGMVKLVLDVFQTTRNFGCLTLREMQSLFFVISEEGIVLNRVVQ